MEAWQLALLLVGILVVFFVSGMPIAFALVAVTLIFMLLVPATKTSPFLIETSFISEGMTFILVAIPLFILMANMLRVSGIADDLYEAMYHWFGGLPGGLASGTIVICAIFAAMVGISGAATLTMGLVALPSMLKRNYNKHLATGSIAAGGALGILIPPSVSFIIYGFITGTSVGRLFIAGIIPGIVLTLMFIIYIFIRCHFRPEDGPPLPEEMRISFTEKLKYARFLILPLILIIAVLGSIYTGITTPTEAASIGAVGSFVCVAIRRKLNWLNVKDALISTVKLSNMILWLVIGGMILKGIVYQMGIGSWAMDIALGWYLAPLAIVGMMNITFIILGCFMDPSVLAFILIPVFFPIVVALGYDPIWFGVLFVINSEIAFLTPPFGINLFYLRSIVPPEITMSDIYRSVIPFIFIQIAALALVVLFPQLALYIVPTW